MSSTKCSACGLVNWASAVNCKRCGAALAPGSNQLSTKNERSNDEKDRIRQSAFRKIKRGAIATAVFVAALFVIPLTGNKFTFNPIGLGVGLVPVAWFLAGVLELTTKTPFEELSERWDNLAGWQRGLIGISVFVGGVFIVLVVSFAIVRIFFW